MTEVADWAVNLPRDSATARAISPDADHTDQLELLRRIEHGIRYVAWQNTKDGHRNRNRPEQYWFGWESKPKVWENDVFEWDEAAEKLGGDPRLAELMARI